MATPGSDSETILEDLNRVFRDLLSDDVRLTRATVAAEVEGWDSLTHISASRRSSVSASAWARPTGPRTSATWST